MCVYVCCAPQLIPGITAEHRSTIYTLFDTHVDAGLTWLSQSGREYIPCVENNRAASLCYMMQSLMSQSRGFRFDKKPDEVSVRCNA